MDYELVKIAGAIAGIGGIAFASVVLIFREVIRKEIFPQLTKEHAYKLLNRIVLLIFFTGVLGITSYLLLNWRNRPPDNVNQKESQPTPTPQSISRIVCDQNYKPLQGARVTLTEFPDMVPVTTSTDGVFHITDIPKQPGDRVRLRVVMEGYTPNPYEEDVWLGLDNAPPEIKLKRK